VRLNLIPELQIEKVTLVGLFLPPAQEKENVGSLLMLGEISSPRMGTDHGTSQPMLSTALSSSSFSLLRCQCPHQATPSCCFATPELQIDPS